MARAPHGWFARVCLIAVVVVMLANPVEVCAEDNWDSEPMTLTVLTATVLEPGTKDIEQEIAREFMKLHPNIKVEIQGVPAPEQHTKIVTLGTVGQLPDVFQDQPEWLLVKSCETGCGAVSQDGMEQYLSYLLMIQACLLKNAVNLLFKSLHYFLIRLLLQKSLLNSLDSMFLNLSLNCRHRRYV
jgi:hypothetical protein